MLLIGLIERKRLLQMVREILDPRQMNPTMRKKEIFQFAKSMPLLFVPTSNIKIDNKKWKRS